MRSDRIRFPGAGGTSLAARLERPDGAPSSWALFAHCFTCSKDLKAVVRISRALVDQGIAVMRFDFTGLGESEGDFSDTDFSSNLDDLVAAANYLDREHQAPTLLIGHSLGGAAVLAAAGRLPGTRAVVTIGAPSDTEHLRRTLLSRAPELVSEEEVEIDLAGRSFRVRRALLEDLERHRMDEALSDLGLPLLVFHSPVDEVVAIDHARRIYKAAKHPKSFVSIDGADHLLLRREEDSRFVAEVLSAWARRYLDPSHGSEEPEPVGISGRVEVVGGERGYTQAIRLGRHSLTADEPVAVGGADRGPDPYDLLLAAVGACKSMTMRMYADRKGWPLEGTKVVLEHSKIHARDCEDCETEKGRIDRIEVAVELKGELSDEQRRRVFEIADRCPVHRTLTSEVSIKSRLDR